MGKKIGVQKRNSTGCQEFVQSPIYSNELYNHTKFDAPDSIAVSKFQKKKNIIFTKLTLETRNRNFPNLESK